MTTNIKKIRIVRNAFEVPTEPEMGESAVFQGSGEFVKKTESNNQDGTVNVVYDLKPSIIEIKSTESQKTIAKDFIKDKSRSKAHRDRLYRLWQARGERQPFEGFYNSRYDSYDEAILKEIDKETYGY